MTDIKSMTVEELKGLMAELGEKPFRAKQIYSWLHEHLVTSYDEMENIPKSLRQKLEQYPITVLETLDVQISKIDGTRKYLFRLSDGKRIHEIQARELCLYLFSGGVPYGMQILCFHDRRTYEKPASVRDAGSDLQNPDITWRAYIQCGCDGNRRADGQL